MILDPTVCAAKEEEPIVENGPQLTDNHEVSDLPQDSGLGMSKTETLNRFKNKVAIVTGGAGNFGKAMAGRLVSEGAKVALWDIKDSHHVKSNLKQKYKDLNPDIINCIVNVTDQQSVRTALLQVIQKFGKVDLLFNNGMHVLFLNFLLST